MIDIINYPSVLPLTAPKMSRPTPSSLSNPQSIDDLLLYRLYRLLSTGSTSVIRLFEGQLGITRREWRVMASMRPDVSLSPSALAEHAQLDRARTSRAVTSLVAKGLIDRQSVPSDQRRATLTLTTKGCKLYDTAFPMVAELNQRLTRGMSEAAILALDAAIVHIQASAETLRNEAGQAKANRRRNGKK